MTREELEAAEEICANAQDAVTNEESLRQIAAVLRRDSRLPHEARSWNQIKLETSAPPDPQGRVKWENHYVFESLRPGGRGRLLALIVNFLEAEADGWAGDLASMPRLVPETPAAEPNGPSNGKRRPAKPK